jgi:hypothetical protein
MRTLTIILVTIIVTTAINMFVVKDCNKYLENDGSLIYGVDEKWNEILFTFRDCNQLVECNKHICNIFRYPNVSRVVIESPYPC